MSTPAADIATHLVNQGYGVLGQSVKVNLITDSPDGLIALTDFGGLPAPKSMGGTRTVVPSIVQVAVRDKNAQQAAITIRNIYDLLDGAMDITVSGRTYQLTEALQPPFFGNRDQLERTTFVFDLFVTRQP